MIDHKTATGIANYLVSLGFLVATTDQGQAWAAYLNSSAAGCEWADKQVFFDACNRLATIQKDAKRLTAGALAAEVRKIGAERIRNAGQPDVVPNDPVLYPRWCRKRAHLLKQGFSPDQAEREAWNAIGQEKPVQLAGASKFPIGQILKQLSAGKTKQCRNRGENRP